MFLDASTHLYKRLCPSVGLSVSPSVCQLVHNPGFFSNCEIQVNSSKFVFGRIVVRLELVEMRTNPSVHHEITLRVLQVEVVIKFRGKLPV